MKKIVIGLLTVAPLFCYAGTMSAATTTRDCYQFNVSDIPADSKYTYAIFRSGKLVAKGDSLTSKENTLYFCEDEPRVHESIYDNPSDAMRPYANSQYATHEYCTDVYKGFQDTYSNTYKIIIDGIKVDTGAEDAKIEFDFSISHNLVSKASQFYDRTGTSVGSLKDDVKISLISPAFTVVNDITKIFNVKVVTSDMVNVNQGSPYGGYSTPVLDRTNVFNPKIYSATNVYYFYTSLPSIQSNTPASQLSISKKDMELSIDYSGGDTNDNKIC